MSTTRAQTTQAAALEDIKDTVTDTVTQAATRVADVARQTHTVGRIMPEYFDGVNQNPKEWIDN
jgi:hypothetical protein